MTDDIQFACFSSVHWPVYDCVSSIFPILSDYCIHMVWDGLFRTNYPSMLGLDSGLNEFCLKSFRKLSVHINDTVIDRQIFCSTSI